MVSRVGIVKGMKRDEEGCEDGTLVLYVRRQPLVHTITKHYSCRRQCWIGLAVHIPACSITTAAGSSSKLGSSGSNASASSYMPRTHLKSAACCFMNSPLTTGRSSSSYTLGWKPSSLFLFFQTLTCFCRGKHQHFLPACHKPYRLKCLAGAASKSTLLLRPRHLEHQPRTRTVSRLEAYAGQAVIITLPPFYHLRRVTVLTGSS